ncbi:MAG TPA: TlpA disulfide reductase family protein [Bryobacteraceae bacterium]|nr:TlpA disulfide reductase family protein [Bryobacteraceae bacterium]
MRTGRLIAFALGLVFCSLAATIPRPAPEFVITLPNGKQTLLSQYRGKIVALAFISTTCPHCQRLTQALTGIQKDYAPRGVQVLETAINQGAAQLVPAFIQQYRTNFPTGYSDWNMVMEFLQISIMSPGYLPKMVFVDRKGVIQAQYAGENPFFADQDQDKNVRAELDKMLQAAAIGARKSAPRKAASK